MKILLINPNTTEALTELLSEAARSVLPPDTTLDSVTAAVGVPYISTRTEAIVGGMSVLEILSERHADYDAAIVAAFGDPGIGAARELFDIPVVGLAEAGMLTPACWAGGSRSSPSPRRWGLGIANASTGTGLADAAPASAC